MNIFVLDKNISTCARYHCDKHVVKMFLESVQILCTVCNQYGVKTPYRSTHRNHPCVKWASQSLQHWRWLRKLAFALHNEYLYRFQSKKFHASYKVLKKLQEPELPNLRFAEQPQAMPEIYQVPGDVVQAYRNYYVGMKRSFATWKRRRMPKWFKQMLEE